MDRKILLQNLADSLAERTGITKRKAEAFVRSFFEVTEEGLLADGLVKAKGFGTTKVVNVNGRESVNINTGERFQIEGHAKVTFTPDTPFRDLVNRPFAHFSTIVLDDDVDLEALNAVDALEPPVGEDADEEEEEQTPSPSAEVSLSLKAEEEQPEAEEEQPEAEEEQPEAEEEQPEAEDEQPEAEDEPENTPSTNEEQAPDDMQPIIIQNTVPAPPANNWWRIAFFTLIALLLAVASYFAGYYRVFCPCTDCETSTNAAPAKAAADNRGAASAQSTEATAPANDEQTNANDEQTNADDADQEADEANAATDAEAEAAAAPKEQAEPAQQKVGPTADELAAAKKYEQFDGDYLITGVLKTHEMAPGDNLYKLAKSVYGDKELARYIIRHNHFDNPDVLTIGQKIEIPRLTHK